jgi:fimbrial chaperone protein
MTFKSRIFTAALTCAALAGVPALAGEFTVNPIRLEMGANVRSGAIGVRNEGKEKLSFQIQGMEWTQDAEGKDQYADTRDLVFFPKIMTVEPGDEGLVRVGARNALVPTEKTYRLFIEELPSGKPAEAVRGAQVNVLVRFGAPIFIVPAKPQDGLEIERLDMAKGVLTIAARNTGNRHQVVQGVNLKGLDAGGREVYALTLADRYLLAGTAKPYATSIAPEQCARIASLSVELKTDRLTAGRKLDVNRAMCP